MKKDKFLQYEFAEYSTDHLQEYIHKFYVTDIITYKNDPEHVLDDETIMYQLSEGIRK